MKTHIESHAFLCYHSFCSRMNIARWERRGRFLRDYKFAGAAVILATGIVFAVKRRKEKSHKN